MWRLEFGWSATVLALAYSLHRAETGLLGPLQGLLIEKFGTRVVMLTGIVVLSAGFVLISRVNGLTTFFIAFGLMAVGGSMTGILTLSTVIVSWFERRRGIALAFLQGGMPAGGLAVPLVAAGMEMYGWRVVAIASAATVICVALPLALTMPGSPRARYPRQVSVDEDVHDDSIGAESSSVDSHFTLRESLRTFSFWSLSLGHAAGVVVIAVLLVHAVIYLTDHLGYTIQGATNIMALMTVATLIGHVLGGYLGDRVPRNLLAAGAMLLHCAAILALTYGATPRWVFSFAILNGLAWGIRAPLMAAMRADYFGRAAFPTISGVMSLVVMGCTMFGPVIVGLAVDRYGTFTPGFTMIAAIAASGCVLFVLTTRPKPRSLA